MPTTLVPNPSPAGVPPEFVRLAAHPLRWRLLEELGQSDRAVWELTELVGERQNLVSYHLRRLRDGRLVSARRSSADGRDTYYALDLASCHEQLGAAGRALHPGLRLVPAPPDPMQRRARPPRVLFLCTGNSARSQMAEALITAMSGGAVEAASAGSRPRPLHPNAVQVMRRRGIDISANRSKHLSEVTARRFDVVITLCDRVREVCPEFPHHPRLLHWSIPDPTVVGVTNRESLPAFERTAAELETRIGFLLHQLNQLTKRATRRTSHVHR